jgi:hypothetical protein
MSTKTTKGFSRKQMEKLFAEIQQAPPTLSLEEMKEIEAAMNEDLGSVRRLALATLTRPGATLLESVKRDREAAVTFAGAQSLLNVYITRLRRVADLLEQTNVFIMMALSQRADLDEINAEVQRRVAAGDTEVQS